MPSTISYILKLTCKVRELQKAYYKTKGHEKKLQILRQVKVLEAKLDNILEAVLSANPHLNEIQIPTTPPKDSIQEWLAR